MPKSLLVFFALCLLHTGSAYAQSQTLVDFDGVTAPCGFSSAVPVTNEYTPVGVTFAGGYVVLDECSNFAVTGHSSPNFLAWSGVGQPPEVLTFSPPVEFVEIYASSVLAGTVTLTAYDGLGIVVDSDALVPTAAVARLSVTGADIVTVELDATPVVGVFDNLLFGDANSGDDDDSAGDDDDSAGDDDDSAGDDDDDSAGDDDDDSAGDDDDDDDTAAGDDDDDDTAAGDDDDDSAGDDDDSGVADDGEWEEGRGSCGCDSAARDPALAAPLTALGLLLLPLAARRRRR